MPDLPGRVSPGGRMSSLRHTADTRTCHPSWRGNLLSGVRQTGPRPE